MKLTKTQKSLMLSGIAKDIKTPDHKAVFIRLLKKAVMSYLTPFERNLVKDPLISPHLKQKTITLENTFIPSDRDIMGLNRCARIQLALGEPLKGVPYEIPLSALTKADKRRFDQEIKKAHKTQQELKDSYGAIHDIVQSCNTLKDLETRLPDLKKYFPQPVTAADKNLPAPAELTEKLRKLGVPPKTKKAA